MWTEIVAFILVFVYCFCFIANAVLASTTDDEQEEEMKRFLKHLKVFGLVVIPILVYLEKY